MHFDLLCRSTIQGLHLSRCRLGSSTDSYDSRGVVRQGRSRGSHLNLLDRGNGKRGNR